MPAGDPPEAHRGRVSAAGFVGNVLEWYDFAVYGFFAPPLVEAVVHYRGRLLQAIGLNTMGAVTF